MIEVRIGNTYSVFFVETTSKKDFGVAFASFVKQVFLTKKEDISPINLPSYRSFSDLKSQPAIANILRFTDVSRREIVSNLKFVFLKKGIDVLVLEKSLGDEGNYIFVTKSKDVNHLKASLTEILKDLKESDKKAKDNKEKVKRDEDFE